jgi:hypothetical protein
MKLRETISILAVFVISLGALCFAICPPADLTGDCRVDLPDFAVLAGQWLKEGNPTQANTGAFNIMDYNAVGDGVADDTNALNAAIEAAAARPSGGVVYCPGGTYKITRTISILTNNITIYGDGWGSTIFKPVFGAANDVFVIGDRYHNPNNCKMSDFRITAASSVAALIHVQNGNGLILSDFFLNGANSASTGLSIDNFSLQSGVHVRDFIIAYVTGNGILVGQYSTYAITWPNEIFLTNGTISTCGSNGLGLVYVDGLYVDTLSIYASTGNGVVVIPNDGHNVSNCFLNKCLSDSSGGDGWYFTHSAGTGVIGNIFLENCYSSLNNGNGLSVQPNTRLNGLQIHGGVYQLNKSTGIIINDTSASNVTIEGVQVGFNGYTQSPNNYCGIFIASGVSDFTIAGCTIGQVGPYSITNTQLCAIKVDTGSSNNYVISNNRCISNQNGVVDLGAGTNKYVAGNIAH